MNRRTALRFWSAVLAAIPTVIATGEYIAIYRAEPGSRAHTASWATKFGLGLEPHHPRRYILVPLFIAFVVGLAGWFIGHITRGWGPNPKGRSQALQRPPLVLRLWPLRQLGPRLPQPPLDQPPNHPGPIGPDVVPGSL